MDIIRTKKAPIPAGHYSQAIVHNGLVYVSGQLPLDPATARVIGEGDIELQTDVTLRNVEAILLAAGSSLDKLLNVTVYIQGRELWPQVNAVYERILGHHKPARAVIPVPEIKPGCLIEISAIATIS